MTPFRLRSRARLRCGVANLALALALGLTPGLAASSPESASTPRPAFGDYLAATAAMQLNDYRFAAEHLLRALASDPRNHGLRQQAFLASVLAGRPEAARLATGLPGDPTATLVLGDEAALAGNWTEAARIYGALPHDGAIGDALRPVLVAWAEYGAGHPELALATLAPFVSGPRLPSLYALHAGLIADLAGRDDEAAADYHLAQQTAPGLNLSLVRILASFTARHGHLQDAEQLVHALTNSAPALSIVEAGIDASLMQRPVADARGGLARAYLSVAALMTAQAEGDGDRQQSQPGRASTLLLLRLGQRLDPGSSEIRLVLADVAQAMPDAEMAISALAPIHGADPLFALAQLRIAELDAVMGHDDEARAVYEDLIRAYPGQAEPARALGELLSDGHRYGEAIGAFDRAIAATTSPGANDWGLFFDRAVAYDRSHQWNRAEADLDHALDLSPEQPYVLNYLGYSYAEQDRNLDEARHMLERALEQKPRDGAFLDSLGWIILKEGHIAEAIDQLQQAAELTPEDPTVNYHLGVAYWDAGRRVEAENQWQRALILNPDPNDLPKIEARLREADAAAPGAAAPGATSPGATSQ